MKSIQPENPKFHLLFILNDKKEPVPCDDPLTWAFWFESHHQDRIVGKTVVGFGTGHLEVSTVFLGTDHSFSPGPDQPPVLWETALFTPKGCEIQARCGGSWEDAEAMHQRIVERVKQELRDNPKKLSGRNG